MNRKQMTVTVIFFAVALTIVTAVLLWLNGNNPTFPVALIVTAAGLIMTNLVLQHIGRENPEGPLGWFGKQTGVSAPVFALIRIGGKFAMALVVLVIFWVVYDLGIPLPTWMRELIVSLGAGASIIGFVLLRSRFKVRD